LLHYIILFFIISVASDFLYHFELYVSSMMF